MFRWKTSSPGFMWLFFHPVIHPAQEQCESSAWRPHPQHTGPKGSTGTGQVEPWSVHGTDVLRSWVSQEKNNSRSKTLRVRDPASVVCNSTLKSPVLLPLRLQSCRLCSSYNRRALKPSRLTAAAPRCRGTPLNNVSQNPSEPQIETGFCYLLLS